MTPWLAIIGIGDDGLAGLAPGARLMVEQADVLVGGERHLSMIETSEAERLRWPTPFSTLSAELQARQHQAVCVLATGDPNWFGVASRLSAELGPEALRVVPSPSAFSLCCARLGWALQDIETLSLHGRAIELLHPYVQPGSKVLALSHDGDTPSAVAKLLCERGFKDSRVTALSHIGGTDENIVSAPASEWNDDMQVADLNTIAITCLASDDAPSIPRVAGLADELFEHDGQMTKREVRAITLSKLAPSPGHRLWDIGAGCGSVSVEWMRAHPSCEAIAVEPEPDRVAMIAANAATLGTPDLEVIAKPASECLSELPRPDAVFVGGGITEPGLGDQLWAALDVGARLVANVVTVEGEGIVASWQSRWGGELTRIGISRAVPIGRRQGWRPMMPVTQFSIIKRASA